MRSIAAALAGFAIAVTTLGLGAAPARADEDLSVRPSKVRAGGWLTIRLLCDPDTETGRIDGPTSFGEIPIDDFVDGRYEGEVRVPSGTSRGRKVVYGYCDADESDASNKTTFLVIGGRPSGGAYTGFGGTAQHHDAQRQSADGSDAGLSPGTGAPGAAPAWGVGGGSAGAAVLGLTTLALGGVAVVRRRTLGGGSGDRGWASGGS